MTATVYEVTYRVEGESAGPTGTISRWAPKRNDDGTFTTTVDLSFARRQGLPDAEAFPRIIAIAHTAGRITAEQVVVVTTDPLTREEHR